MGNRPLMLPIQKTKKIPDLNEWGNLKNKFSGKTLFRLKLYYLETGDLSLLDIINNKWFYEELFAYSRAKQEINLVPALKKIAGSEKYDESLRQHASEVMEILEEQALTWKDQPKITSDSDEYEKAVNARRILGGTRFPQTTEVLRLLRDKSPELKRLALFLIGKFKMTSMIQEVCESLSTQGLEDDAYSVLLSFGSSAAREIYRYCLTASGNISTRKTVIRLLSQINQVEDMSFLLEQLWSNSRQIKEMVLETLLVSKYKVSADEKERLVKYITETFGILTWIITAQISLLNNNNALLSAEMNKEYTRWKNYISKLLILTYNSDVLKERKDPKGKRDDLSRSVLEMAGIIFDGSTKTNPAEAVDPVYFKKKLKKLQRHFPYEIPAYKSLLEDIINCDYNLISIWTKACAIRHIPEITGEDLGESVVALLFSPEEVLREEAARLIARSDKELYDKTSGRIPEFGRKKLDNIISGDAIPKELVYEKVQFLSSCFEDLNEDELLFLAEKISFVRKDAAGIYWQPSDTILWSFSEEKPDPEVFVNHEDITDPGKIVKDIRSACSYCYVLPLKTVLEFNFQYADSSFGIFNYIDKNEE